MPAINTSEPPTGANGRASILSTISRGKRPRHIFALIYGVDGVGKSHWASCAPSPIFIGAEKGTEQLDVARFPQTDSTGELLAQIRALQTEKHEFDSVVLDSLDWVEPLIWKAVCQEGKVETIEQYAGGYGKGYVRALDIWRTLIRELSVLNDKMHVLLIGHAQIKSFQDPELPTAYDRYQLKINDKAAALVREATDAVLFARFDTELVRDNGSKAKVRGEGNRIMYTESRPGWDAKNRFNLPFCMALDWKTFGEAIRVFYGLSGGKKSVPKVETPDRQPEQAASDSARSEQVAKQNGNGAADSKSERQPVQPRNSASPLKMVRRHLEQSKIAEEELSDVLKVLQLLDSNQTLATLPDKTLALVSEHWETVIVLVDELRERKAEGK